MKSLKYFLCTALFAITLQSAAMAQSHNFSELIKQHFNETIDQVKSTDDPEKKRAYLNESFDSMLDAIDRIEQIASLDEEESAQLASLKNDVEDKKSELNGLDGFDEIVDEDLDDFSDYSQQMMEQANRTVTLSLTTALLIALILILL